jgi:hypothetical protein
MIFFKITSDKNHLGTSICQEKLALVLTTLLKMILLKYMYLRYN